MSEGTYVVHRDTSSVAWLHASRPESSRVVQISYSFVCNDKWLKSFRGKFFLWMKRRGSWLYPMIVDEGELNFRVWSYLIGENYYEFDPREMLAEMAAIGKEVQRMSYS